eukprot:3657470-Rhodomonas_salina.2
MIVDAPPCSKSKPTIIVEFARGYSIEIAEDKSAVKQNQYQGTLRLLTAQYPQHKVRCHSLIMSVFGTIPQDSWLEQLKGVGLSPGEAEGMEPEGLGACFTAGHALHNTCRSRLEALRARGIHISTAGHHTNSKGIG